MIMKLINLINRWQFNRIGYYGGIERGRFDLGQAGGRFHLCCIKGMVLIGTDNIAVRYTDVGGRM